MRSIKKFFNTKKAQLGFIEAKFLMIGLLIGIILAIAVVYMANNDILIPFSMRFLCPAVQ